MYLLLIAFKKYFTLWNLFFIFANWDDMQHSQKKLLLTAQFRKIMQNQWDSSHHPYCKYQIEIFLLYIVFVWLKKNSAILFRILTFWFCLKKVFDIYIITTQSSFSWSRVSNPVFLRQEILVVYLSSCH